MEQCLYTGRVSHNRFYPRSHRFAYGIAMVMLDVDGFAGRTATGLPGWLGALLPLRRRDHLKDYPPGVDLPLGKALAGLVWERAGIRLDPAGKVFLLTGFGFLWHRFNPVSFYYCLDRSGELQCLVAEVTNTPWREQFHYVLDARDQDGSRELTFSCAKEFHVSPFMPMDTRYQWRLSRPEQGAFINIGVERQGRRLFSATLDLEREPLTPRRVIAAMARQPLMSLGVSLRIHWQALRLWLKATPFYPHPHPRCGTGDKQ